MSGFAKAFSFLALKRNIVLLLGALVLAGTGERLWLNFVPKYLQFLGAGILVIGSFDALQTLLGALYAYPGGILTDRIGQRRSLLIFSVVAIVGYLIVLLWEHWLAVLIGSFFFLAWSALSLPATFTVVATSLESHKHTMGIGVQSMVRRVPMMIGPVIGGTLVTAFGWRTGLQYALAGCIVLIFATIILQWQMVDAIESSTKKEASNVSFRAVVKSFSPGLRDLLVSDILIRFCERIPYAFVILWAMNYGGISAQQFGTLIAIEMGTAMFCYIPVAHLADKYGRRPFVLITFGFFTLFPITLLWAHSFGWLALAFAVRGLKEFGEPARKALIISEADPNLRSRSFGAYYLIRDCVVTTGSFLGTWLWSISPQANFIGAAVCGGMGAVWFWRFIYRQPISKR
jgi:MFS family permease